MSKKVETNKDTKKASKKASNKWISFVIEGLKSPLFVGILVTGLMTFIAITFYAVRSQNDGERIFNHPVRQFIFEVVEFLDLKNQDARLRLRGEEPPSPQAALLTIDDRTLEQIGRWPWSREKIAFVVEEMMKYGASAIGFDIVFAEPQIEGTEAALSRIESRFPNLPPALKMAIEEEKRSVQPDRILAETLAKYDDKLVLGSFNEGSMFGFTPFQDYCRNEAFRRTNAEKFVKLNATFIVDDQADPFVDLEFENIFMPIFAEIERTTTEDALKEVFGKSSVESLDTRERNQLEYMRTEAILGYCNEWLEENDRFGESPELAEVYKEVFSKSEILKGKELAEMISTFKAAVKPMPITQYNRWTINTDLIQENMTYTGSFNAEQDSDGSIRRASMFFRTGNKIGTSFVPSIALQTYLLATGYRANVEIDLDPKNPHQKIIKRFSIVDPSTDPETPVGDIPIDEIGRMKINYAGGTAMYPYLPVKELFNGKETMDIEQTVFNAARGSWEKSVINVNKKEFIQGRAFIFGLTAIGVYDLRVTPFEKNYPGPETHVTALGNLFDRNFIQVHPSEDQIMIWTVVLFGLLLSFAISKTSAIPGFLITFGSLASIAGLDQLFLKKGYVTTMSLPALLVVGLYVILFFYKYLTEERKKKYLKSTFSKYVSPAIVDEILKDPENIELGGKKTRMTVSFSDVRGFTTISEKLEPQVLSDVLNMYLTPMTNLVFDNKGTLDKYMGDAIMSFFGAPIFFEDHAEHACRCALKSLEKLKELQQEFKSKGLPMIDIGIGINTGDMSVGNMGSDIVRSYTVMGDSVNLASRLEGINKEYGTRIIISEFTQKDVANKFTTREVDWVKVKGKNEPVRIFELICEGAPAENKKKTLDLFKEGFDLYHQRNFQLAKLKFEEALTIDPEDPPTKLYVERCEEYLSDPPGENWDGVYTMKTK